MQQVVRTSVYHRHPRLFPLERPLPRRPRNPLLFPPIELKRTGTLPEAGNLKPKFWGSGGITRPPCENRARPFAKYKQNPGRKLQEMS